jgi:hypothetical protein
VKKEWFLEALSAGQKSKLFGEPIVNPTKPSYSPKLLKSFPSAVPQHTENIISLSFQLHNTCTESRSWLVNFSLVVTSRCQFTLLVMVGQ